MGEGRAANSCGGSAWIEGALFSGLVGTHDRWYHGNYLSGAIGYSWLKE